MSTPDPLRVCVRRVDDALWRATLEAAVVLPPGAAEPLRLEGPARIMWSLIEQPMSLADLVDALADGYGVGPHEIEADVEEALSELISSGAAAWVR